MSLRALMGGASKCRTIDVCDIFGDSSGKALYRLDGNANDESGNYHGTETNVTYGGGVYDRGAVFNGSNSYINTGYAFPYTAFSYSFHYKYGSINKMIISSVSTNPVLAGQFNLTQISATSLLVEFINNNSGTTTTIPNQTVPNMNDGLFHHIVVTCESGGFMKLYFDGALIAISSAVPTFVNSNTQALNLMREPRNNYYKDGLLDQVRIFNRAITATEVATLYAECAPTSIVDNIDPFEDGSLKALYKFEDNANDSTGVYNGTPTSVTYGTGKFGKCAVFGGSTVNAKITIPYTFPSGGNSISIWAKVDTANQADGFLFGYSSGARQSMLRGDYNLLSAGTWMHRLPAGQKVCETLDQWHHIVYTSNGSEPLKLYVDGVLRTNLISTNFNWATFAIDGLGFYNTGATGNLTGKLDQLRIFNKALTPIEIASLYNETTPLEEPLYALVDPFKDGSGKALYRLDGNTLDESGNYNGTPTALTYGLGRFGRCGVFNGSTSYVDTNFTVPTTDFSISLYVKLNSNSNGYLIGNVLPNAYSIGWMLYHSSSTGLSLGTDNNGAIPWQMIREVGSPLQHSVWKHIVLSVSGSTQKLYIDNIDTSFPVTVGSNTSLSSGSLSSKIGGLGTWWINGSIDQVRIFNRALTQQEVTTLYTEGA